jgi:precorrin-3B C17-methyltransferase
MSGKIYVTGIGPGDIRDLTPRATAAIAEADVIIGYSTYIDALRGAFPDKQFISSRMTHEVERGRDAIARAVAGAVVVVVSSGDSGVYGMAGLVLELLERDKVSIPIEIVPGITAATAAAALLGAPLNHDFAVISLSDLLTPWETIEKRLLHAVQGDFVVCLYNPRSTKRTQPLERAVSILSECRPPETIVGIVRNAGRDGQSSILTDLAHIPSEEIDMLSILIVGNSSTRVCAGRMVTPTGYPL